MLACADHEWKTEAFSRSALVNVDRSFAMTVLCSLQTVTHPLTDDFGDVDLESAVPLGHLGREVIHPHRAEHQCVRMERLQVERVAQTLLRVLA